MPAELTAHFKIFKSDYGIQGNTKNMCFLTAHGAGRSTSPRSFIVPDGMTLLFPSEVGEAVGVPPVVLGNVNAFNANFTLIEQDQASPIVVRRLGEGEVCENYELSKYQGRHNSSWPGFISYLVTRKDSWKDTFGEEHYSDIEAAVGNGLNADVVTVRNRWKWHTPTLYELVNFLGQSLSYNYTYLYCSFCLSDGCFPAERWHFRA